MNSLFASINPVVVEFLLCPFSQIFLKELKQRMIDCFGQDWSAKVNGSDRFGKYRSFKSLLQPEKYLTAITINKFSCALVKFQQMRGEHPLFTSQQA